MKRCVLRSIEEAEDLATRVLAASLLVVHDTERGRQHDVPELCENETNGMIREVVDQNRATKTRTIF